MKFFIIDFVVILFAFLLVLLANKKPKKQVQKSVKELSNNSNIQQQTVNVSIALYTDLINIFKEGLRYVATIEELNLLIDNNAEIQPTILHNCSKEHDYKYFETLLIWKKSYLQQLNLYYQYMKDIYNAVFKLNWNKDEDEFFKQLSHVGAFLDKENQKEKRKDI